MRKKTILLPLLSISSILSFLPFAASGATVGYWRFENSSNVGEDSSGNGFDMTNNTAPADVDVISNASFTDFPNPVPQTGAPNAQTGNFDSPATSYLSIGDQAEFGFQNFTIESYVRLNSSSGSTTPSIIAGQFDSSDAAWQFGTTGGGSGLGANRLFLQISQGASASFTKTLVSSGDDFLLEIGKDYYVAASVNYSNPGGVEATFYIQNLTDNETIAMSTDSDTYTSLYNSSTDFTIGASYSNGSPSRYFAGWIDEVRLSDTALSQSELLSIPEPNHYGLLGSIAVLFVISLRRRKRS
ncbi:LamG-like jellyroll fold domain-containing protein [Puniceicoccus vermicola]|uniref:PEP-CTERM sorting domain-containing protein n=1 Tax=Puniceicoccus vermicola TaxID=388746 RepID=A0A7X1B3H8_9BACT|nr:LamG-like jellyroll fold domain-containing protein [Puniceicoccus vermicola]MBC2603853.1 PEP-CTERM sorting domain-containing protein [Puniceicoccus vermicola]